MKQPRQKLLGKPTCPNCWKQFSTEQVKWISGHEELVGDERLGDDAPLRFTPSQFDIACNAVDIRGISCKEIACPWCHLKIPRSTLELAPFFLSIVGTPSCGKSFFLASMTWQNRKTLPEKFGLSFTDSDTQCNQLVNSYEERLFFNADRENLVQLPKTDVAGDNYATVAYEDQSVTYPKPLFFDISLTHEAVDKEKSSAGTSDVESTLAATKANNAARLLCLYDNAGESFLPGADSVTVPVTRHLGLAEAWMFCFDPTQDPRFRGKLAGKTTDHQVTNSPVTARQDLVLTEMVNRIREFCNLGVKVRSEKPLIVVCTKFDAWSKLLGPLGVPWRYSKKRRRHVLNLEEVERVSSQLKNLLRSFCPEIHAAAQSISQRVFFVPVSATGTPPVEDPVSGDYRVRSDQIKPIWCEVPMLLSLAFRAPKLVRAARGTSSKKPTSSESSEETPS